MLAISRRTDALERIGREIMELLDHRPPSPAVTPLALVSSVEAA
jgi:hypothetical protein